jgi:dynein heavy chain
VSTRFISEVDIIHEEALKQKIAKMCVVVHESVNEEAANFYDSLKRKVYITPKSYLDLIKSYQVYLAEKNKELSDRRNTLFTGLSKLEETNREVAKLSEELIIMQPNLEQSVIEAE